MAQIVRLFDFKASTTIKSQEVDDELNALVSAHNDLDTTRMKKAGDTMTGALILNADPVAALGAATKQLVDNVLTNAIFTGPVLMGGVIDDDLTLSSPSKFKVKSIGASAGTNVGFLDDIEMSGNTLFTNSIKQSNAELIIENTLTSGSPASDLSIKVAGATSVIKLAHENTGSVKISAPSSGLGKLRLSIITDEGDQANQEIITKKGSPDRWEIGHASGGSIKFLQGVLIMDAIPTSDPSSTGELWNDSGTMKISA